MAVKPAPRTAQRFAAIRRWARRQWIVNPSYQYRTMLPPVIAAVVFALLFGAVVYFPMHRSLQAEPDPGIQVLLAEQLLQLNFRMWPVLLLAVAVACVYALQYSHKVAGPLYRLNIVLKDMAQGKDVKNVHFRDGDEFREFEKLASILGERMKNIRTQNRDVGELIINAAENMAQLKEMLGKEEGVTKEDLLWKADFVLEQLKEVSASAKKKQWGYVAPKK